MQHFVLVLGACDWPRRRMERQHLKWGVNNLPPFCGTNKWVAPEGWIPGCTLPWWHRPSPRSPTHSPVPHPLLPHQGRSCLGSEGQGWLLSLRGSSTVQGGAGRVHPHHSSRSSINMQDLCISYRLIISRARKIVRDPSPLFPMRGNRPGSVR